MGVGGWGAGVGDERGAERGGREDLESGASFGPGGGTRWPLRMSPPLSFARTLRKYEAPAKDVAPAPSLGLSSLFGLSGLSGPED
jgi:hypothetical protein